MNKYLQGEPNYDKWPVIKVKNVKQEWPVGWEAITRYLLEELNKIQNKQKLIVFECYQGVMDDEIIPALQSNLQGSYFFSKDCMLAEDKIDSLVYPDVTDDEVFGRITRLNLKDFFDAPKTEAAKKTIEETEGIVIVYGPGACLLCPLPDLLIYADMPRWEIQQRFRKNKISNLGACNKELKASLQYKRAFFVDWRVCDRMKKQLMNRWDFVLDTTMPGQPKMVSGEDLRSAFSHAVTQPFRVVPFFDPGPWGGQWMKEYCDLDRNVENFAWCFDCVPEENSLLLQFSKDFHSAFPSPEGEARLNDEVPINSSGRANEEVIFETPAINLVLYQSQRLLGDAVQERFGDEFPIRFDFLDTMSGGNLSLQVHPTTEYIQEKFRMPYTQDESYYILDAGDDACVYLGLKDNISSKEMIRDLNRAQEEGVFFDAEKYVEKWPVQKHDHVLIPAGTVHCSGANSMVLEISATPYIFTFKLWDWGRMGLDDKPRPINIEHGQAVIDWSRTKDWVKNELINTVQKMDEGPGWVEEKTGLHELEFIETRRHWFTQKVVHHTNGSVNVLNLVEGKEAIVESPAGTFEPFIVHYAETFIIPEAVKEYTVMPHGLSKGQQCATIKAFVRIKKE